MIDARWTKDVLLFHSRQRFFLYTRYILRVRSIFCYLKRRTATLFNVGFFTDRIESLQDTRCNFVIARKKNRHLMCNNNRGLFRHTNCTVAAHGNNIPPGDTRRWKLEPRADRSQEQPPLEWHGRRTRAPCSFIHSRSHPFPPPLPHRSISLRFSLVSISPLLLSFPSSPARFQLTLRLAVFINQPEPTVHAPGVYDSANICPPILCRSYRWTETRKVIVLCKQRHCDNLYIYV